MIDYQVEGLGVGFIFRVHGSVFPKALCWAIPNMLLAIGLHYLLRWNVPELRKDNQYVSMFGMDVIWSGYTFVLGFLVVFRNNQSYVRFWEGATLVNQIRGEWYNATSSLFAFCNRSTQSEDKVYAFQQLLVRLMSMLFCSALQQVCELDDDTLEIISVDGLDADKLEYLQEANDRCEILVQWIQRLIVEANESEALKIPAPILSRCFQELSRGAVNLNNVRKIRDIPFPFPYAQMITCMLLVHWIITPILASFEMESPLWAGVTCFFVTFAFWCLMYIAQEIDQPFGSDANDLPVHSFQKDFNKSLLCLLDARTQSPPTFGLDESIQVGLLPSLRGSDQALKSLRNHLTADVGDHHFSKPYVDLDGMKKSVTKRLQSTGRSTSARFGSKTQLDTVITEERDESEGNGVGSGLARSDHQTHAFEPSSSSSAAAAPPEFTSEERDETEGNGVGSGLARSDHQDSPPPPDGLPVDSHQANHALAPEHDHSLPTIGRTGSAAKRIDVHDLGVRTC